MRKITIIITLAMLMPLCSLAQGWPANYGGVMLQGFFWDSYKSQWDGFETLSCPSGSEYTWATMYGAGWGDNDHWEVPRTTWTNILAHKSELTPYFDLIWLPQSGSTVCPATTSMSLTDEAKGNWDGSRNYVDRAWRNDKGGNYRTYVGGEITNPDCMGFVPVFYFNHGRTDDFTQDDKTWHPKSYFGTEEELKKLIAEFKAEGTGAVEDVVSNHRGGLSNWSNVGQTIDFPNETWGNRSVTWTNKDVCNDDESGLGAGNPDCGTMRRAYSDDDSGRGSWARDIDHHSAQTREKVMLYLKYLRDELGYVGYRYDYAKGFEEKHFAEYNTKLGTSYSVGEFWGSEDMIKKWIQCVYDNGGYQSAAFDFPLMNALNDAFNNGNYRGLDGAGLISDYRYKRYAVTFVDNHDTFKDLPTDNSNRNYGNRTSHNVLEANAFILAMPGTPCLFWPHYMNKNWQPDLQKLIKARRTAGITNESAIWSAELKGNNGIQWRITGNNGEVYMQLGDAVSAGTPSGFTEVWASSICRFSISSELYSQITDNKKTNLLQGYPIIDKGSGSYTMSGGSPLQVTVKPSQDGTTLVYTTNGHTPVAGDKTLTAETVLSFSETTTLKVGVLGSDNKVATSSIVTREYVADNSEQFTIYVKCDDAPNLYLWYENNNGSTTELNGNYAGAKATETTMVGGVQWFKKTFTKPAYPVNLIINWDGNNDTKTPDITNITGDRFFTLYGVTPIDVTGTFVASLASPMVSINKASGTYQGHVTATMTLTNPNAQIVYTTDGSEPTATHGTVCATGTTVTYGATGNRYLRAACLYNGEIFNQVARTYYIENGDNTTGMGYPMANSGIDIYVKNNGNRKLYAWYTDNGSTVEPNGAWGDVQYMSDKRTVNGTEYYYRHFDLSSLNVIIHDGNGSQSKNIEKLTSGSYYFSFNGSTGSEVTNDGKNVVTVYVKKAGLSSNSPRMYAWRYNDVNLLGTWGNEPLVTSFNTTTIDGETWYYKTFTNNAPFSVILHDDSGQTGDITGISRDIYLTYSGGSTYSNVTAANSLSSTATWATDAKFFYFENNWQLASPYTWVWNGTTVFSGSCWPGDALVDVVGTAPNGNLIYRWTYYGDKTPAQLMFSDQGNNKTKEFNFVNGGYYNCDGYVGTVSDNIRTLSDLAKCSSSDVGKTFIISNDLVAAYANDTYIFAKDNDGDANKVSRNTAGKRVHQQYADLQSDANGTTDYDQSNWIQIKIKSAGKSGEFHGKKLLGQTMVGTLKDAQNPYIELDADPIPTENVTYKPNVFIPANFVGQEKYFFVEPKPNEYVSMDWAIYDSATGAFYVAKDNGSSVVGGVLNVINSEYVENNYTLKDNTGYQLTGIVKRKSGGYLAPSLTPALKAEPLVGNLSGDWEFYLISAYTDDKVTAIEGIDAGDATLVSTRYVNLMGVESDRPMPGINVVVRQWSNGIRTVTKQLFK